MIFRLKINRFSFSIMNISKSSLKAIELFIIYSCILVLSFGLNHLDTQPWSLLLITIYILSKMKFASRDIFILWAFAVVTIIFSLSITMDNFRLTLLIRAICNYTTVFFIWAFSILVHEKFNPIKHYLIGSWIYSFVGVLQLLGITSLDWIAANRTTDIRGSSSLATETTF